MRLLPMADASSNEKIKEEARRFIYERNLVGAANNTKWNELISEIREWKPWQPSYRSKWVNGYISYWDTEWYYHLPFPFVGVQWLDIGTHQEVMTGQLIENEIIDHSEKIINLLDNIGFSFAISDDFIRVWGYLPHCFEKFED
ncbi:DUF6678 family protein [Pseudoalteromonas rubra]|uniref:DUF6678 family protein n=1 Tax=Pseudoalteromonas rubra TaxID=43658 RepID=UPI000F79F9FE|nr:DUF6678 family protein [Pseudoalteromonas rubra]